MGGRNLLSRVSLIALLLGGNCLPAAAFAQDFVVPDATYPSLPKRAASAEGLVPAGWVLEAQVSGDLNGDGIPDLAFVVRQTDPRNVIDRPGMGESPFDTNPRILAVAFRSGAAGEYVLQLENHALIPRHENPSQDDPFENGIAIERGGLRVTLRLFMNAGGWNMFTATHTFRHRNGRFELIGYDRSSVHRASGETDDISVNYLVGRMRIASGHISSDKPTKVRQATLKRRAPLTIDAVGDGLDFDPER